MKFNDNAAAPYRLVRAYQKKKHRKDPIEDSIDRLSFMEKERVETVDQASSCECDEGWAPGILLAMAPDSNASRAWVQRCDSCCLFESDDAAAFFAARLLKKEVGFARFDKTYSPRPYFKGMTYQELETLAKKKVRA